MKADNMLKVINKALEKDGYVSTENMPSIHVYRWEKDLSIVKVFMNYTQTQMHIEFINPEV